jgi:hypothetical protein
MLWEGIQLHVAVSCSYVVAPAPQPLVVWYASKLVSQTWQLTNAVEISLLAQHVLPVALGSVAL